MNYSLEFSKIIYCIYQLSNGSVVVQWRTGENCTKDKEERKEINLKKCW